MELKPEEIARCSNIFRASLFQRAALAFYWIPSARHITSRRLFRNKEPMRRLPADAILIGRYQLPCSGLWFVEDLVELVSSLPEPSASASETEGGLCAAA